MKRFWISGALLLVGACRTESAPGGNAQPSLHPEPPPAARANAAPVPPVVPAPGAALAPPARDFFSLDWAKRQSQRGAADSARAEELRAQAYALYKQKRDAEAVVLYEQALALQPSGQLYYDYANSLSNVNRLPDSVRAYELAVELEYAHPEIALYNEACAHSRLEDARSAFASLERAVAKGYVAFSRMEKDSDLEFLRQQPEWKDRFRELSGSPEILVGKLLQYDNRTNWPYVVCPNGIIEGDLAVGLDDSCCGSRKIGRVSANDGKFVVRWQKHCGRSGTGGRKSPNEQEICQFYKGCTKEEVCKDLKVEQEELLSIADAQAILAKPIPDPEPGDWEHKKLDGPLPAVCQMQL